MTAVLSRSAAAAGGRIGVLAFEFTRETCHHDRLLRASPPCFVLPQRARPRCAPTPGRPRCPPWHGGPPGHPALQAPQDQPGQRPTSPSPPRSPRCASLPHGKRLPSAARRGRHLPPLGRRTAGHPGAPGITPRLPSTRPLLPRRWQILGSNTGASTATTSASCGHAVDVVGGKLLRILPEDDPVGSLAFRGRRPRRSSNHPTGRRWRGGRRSPLLGFPPPVAKMTAVGYRSTCRAASCPSDPTRTNPRPTWHITWTVAARHLPPGHRLDAHEGRSFCRPSFVSLTLAAARNCGASTTEGGGTGALFSLFSADDGTCPQLRLEKIDLHARQPQAPPDPCRWPRRSPPTSRPRPFE